MANRWGYSKGVVQKWLRKNGLEVPKQRVNKFKSESLLGRTTSTKKIDRFLQENYLSMPVKRMADRLNKSHCFIKNRLRQLKLKTPRHIIDKFKKDSLFKPGHVSSNKGKPIHEWMSKDAIKRSKKGRFKKGRKSPNELPDGAITIRTGRPTRGGNAHKCIRIRKGVWKELQIYNWEKSTARFLRDLSLPARPQIFLTAALPTGRLFQGPNMQ